MDKTQTPLTIPDQPKVYVASSLSNWKRVRSIRDKLIEQGITITYDWSQWGQDIFGEDDETGGVLDLNPEGIKPKDELLEIAWNEIQGVLEADTVLVIMPGERGSHFEMAIAWFAATPVVLLTDRDTAPRPTSFHLLPRIECIDDEQVAIDRTVELARALHLANEFKVSLDDASRQLK